jgi:DNA-binding response OmpR family regulator
LFTSRFAPTPPWRHNEMDEFIAKPFHPRELLGCVFELIERDGGAQNAAAEHLGYCHA